MRRQKICELPLEIMIKVLKFLSHNDALKAINVCKHFQNGVCSLLKAELIDLRNKVQQEINNCLLKLHNMPLNEDHLRIDFVKLLTFLRITLTEVDIIFAIVWRYSKVNSVWAVLCPSLCPIMEEFNRNVEQQVNMQARHLVVNFHNFCAMFPKWREFLTSYDGELCEKLNSLMPYPSNFEMMAIDMLTCCPSINFQIAFSRPTVNTMNDTFNIYSFFKLNHLKPACQIPNVHNSQLNNKNKQFQLLKFLRECIQWENIAHLQEAFNEILDLELRLWVHLDFYTRDNLIKELNEKYLITKTNPYAPVVKSTRLSYSEEGAYWSECYRRFSSYNECFTCLRCIVDIPNQKVENLPLIFPTFRGWTHNSLHEILCSEDVINLNWTESKFSLVSHQEPKINRDAIFQLIIQYRERLYSTPAEAIINVTYDDTKEYHITMDLIGSEPFATPAAHGSFAAS